MLDGPFLLAVSAPGSEVKPVIHTFVHDAEQTLVLSFANGEQVETTPGHPFFVEGKGFVLAGHLALGNAIVPRAGPATILVSIQHKTGRTCVYNFEVADFHTYFVGSHNGGLWVHNQSYRIHGVAPDWAVKGAHITYHGVELAVRPGQGGSIVFKPVFSNGGQVAATAAGDARHLLGNRTFLTALLRQVSSAVPYVTQFPNEGGLGRFGELHFLEKAIRFHPGHVYRIYDGSQLLFDHYCFPHGLNSSSTQPAYDLRALYGWGADGITETFVESDHAIQYVNRFPTPNLLIWEQTVGCECDPTGNVVSHAYADPTNLDYAFYDALPLLTGYVAADTNLPCRSLWYKGQSGAYIFGGVPQSSAYPLNTMIMGGQYDGTFRCPETSPRCPHADRQRANVDLNRRKSKQIEV